MTPPPEKGTYYAHPLPPPIVGLFSSGNTVPGSKGWVDALLSPQILLEDPAADVSSIAALSTEASGAVVSPVAGAASAAESDDAAPADDSRAPTAPLSGVAEGTVPLVAGAAFDAGVSSAESGALAAPPTDVVGKKVPPVAGAAAGTAADAAPADDVGASATPFDDTSGKIRVPVIASAAVAATASATAVCCCHACRAEGKTGELR